MKKLTYEEAIEILQKTKRLTGVQSEQINGLANALFDGRWNLVRDRQKAITLYRMAAEKAAKKGDDYAQNVLGYYYMEGIGVEKNEEKANSFFLKAAREQNENAALNLAESYRKGIGVERDLKESLRWYRLAKRWCIDLDYDNLEKNIKEVKEMIKSEEQESSKSK